MPDDKSVSVVVAVWRDTDGLPACLSALETQRSSALEVLLPATVPAPTGLLERFPWVRWLDAEADALVPHLWALGIGAARGDVVALTTAHFAPAPDWIDAHRAAQAAHPDAAGIGGSIDPPRGTSAVDWATWFQRYGSYVAFTGTHVVDDIAADNASYEGAALRAHEADLPEGFWEPEFHRLVLAEGRTLVFDATVRVTMTTSFGLRRFCGQRLHHGHRYGTDRMAHASLSRRLVGLVTAPLIPAVLTLRLLRRMRSVPEHRGPLLRSLPVLLLFILCWTAGEVWGYLTPSSRA